MEYRYRMPNKNRTLRFNTRCWIALLVLQAILVTAAGCNDSKPFFTPEREAEDLAYGKQMYHDNNCARCHCIAGVGGHVGPDLTHVGAKYSQEWLYTQINSPTSHNPSSHMPAFKDKMLDGSIQFLAVYLYRLK